MRQSEQNQCRPELARTIISAGNSISAEKNVSADESTSVDEKTMQIETSIGEPAQIRLSEQTKIDADENQCRKEQRR